MWRPPLPGHGAAVFTQGVAAFSDDPGRGENPTYRRHCSFLSECTERKERMHRKTGQPEKTPSHSPAKSCITTGEGGLDKVSEEAVVRLNLS